MDVHTKERRSYNMSQIKGRNTKPEILLRKTMRMAGIKGYRNHAKLIGRPDIYFPSKKLAIFVDGCFWHKCPRCYVRPLSNTAFWDEKIQKNVQRDKRVRKELQKHGVTVLRFWQHEIKHNPEKCCNKVIAKIANIV